ncbi:hypothetical protein [Blastococcus sp. URHD0036]|uniref:hypothetical protein n=1 Tax=Blastococcus sp. URHD0036 TaxID=1380356 RepID=UPI00049653CE|nr:hypothetical protein [Blastococcus sp. URHD0036]
MAHNGEDPAAGPASNGTEPTLPERGAGSGRAAPTVTGQPAWSAPPPGWSTSAPGPAAPEAGPGAGYGEYPAMVGALPPLGWTLPTPPEGIPVVVPGQQPEPEAGRGGAGLGILIGVLVAFLVLGIGALTWFLLAGADGDGSTDGALGGHSGGVTSPADVQPVGDDEEGTGTGPAADPEADAVAELDALAAADAARVDLDGRWVAQLASKSVGTTDPLQVAANGSHVFYGTDILLEHQALLQEVGGAADVLLLTSTDFGKRAVDGAGRPYWVTLADPGWFTSSEDVVAWCADLYPTMTAEQLANSCAPRTLDLPHD